MTSGYVLMEPCRTEKATADAKGSSAEEVLTAGEALSFDFDFPQIGFASKTLLISSVPPRPSGFVRGINCLRSACEVD